MTEEYNGVSESQANLQQTAGESNESIALRAILSATAHFLPDEHGLIVAIESAGFNANDEIGKFVVFKKGDGVVVEGYSGDASHGDLIQVVHKEKMALH